LAVDSDAVTDPGTASDPDAVTDPGTASDAVADSVAGSGTASGTDSDTGAVTDPGAGTVAVTASESAPPSLPAPPGTALATGDTPSKVGCRGRLPGGKLESFEVGAGGTGDGGMGERMSVDGI
jgi:hypothetical protein